MDRSKLKEYIGYIEQKYKFYQENDISRNDPNVYLQGIQDELEEVKIEFHNQNLIYLEDELGDILWDYLNLLYILESSGKIRGIDHVISGSLMKYGERVTDKLNGVTRSQTKQRQKKELEQKYINYSESL